MTVNERPGIYSSYEVSSALAGSGIGGAVGIAAVVSGNADTAYTISSYADAVSKFGTNSQISELIRILFLNGAPSIVAAPVQTAATVQDYEAAFAVLQGDETVRVLVCDSANAAVHAAMLSSILSAPENSKFRIGVVETSGTVQGVTTAAEALNSERIVMAAPAALNAAGVHNPGAAAAALAGAIAAQSDPAVPLNGAHLLGLYGLGATLSDADINTLVRGGVTPLEFSGGRAFAIRGVTTRTKTGGAPDTTWRELTTTLILDDVITTVKNSLRSRFARAKNTAQTRGAIRTQVMIELENKQNREIIDSYTNVSVAPAPSDPTVCEVSFDFAVSHGLNQIFLNAHITV